MTVRLLVGDCRAKLKELPDNSVHVCVTSPPFFGLRDYGTARWEGGSPDCDHRQPGTKTGPKTTLRNDGRAHTGPYEGERALTVGFPYKDRCGKCGATRVDGQIGLEGSLADFIAALVGVFREVRRILHPTGLLFVNMGDSYASKPVGSFNGGGFKDTSARNGTRNMTGVATSGTLDKVRASGLKEKDLMLVPARLAIALVDDGWWLRSDIIWHKKAPMPESVTDRPTSAHEHIFMFAKQARYFYDATAVAEPALQPEGSAALTAQHKRGVLQDLSASTLGTNQGAATRNLRNVWTLGSEPFSGAAVYGTSRKVSPDCPVHGYRASQARARSGDGPQAVFGSDRNRRTDARPVPAQAPADAATPQDRFGPLFDGFSATPRSTQNRRTADGSTPNATSGDTPASGIACMERSHPMAAEDGRTLGSSTGEGSAPSDRSSDPLGQTSFRNARTETQPTDALASTLPDGEQHNGSSSTSADSDQGAASLSARTAAGSSDMSKCSCPSIPDHYAVFPRELPRRCIKAGSSQAGCCPNCLSPWRRVVERESLTTRPISSPLGVRGENPSGNRSLGQPQQSHRVSRVETTGWEPTCVCGDTTPIPCTVLDPFAGAGTTGLVADELGRDAVLVELSPEYARMAEQRIYGAAPLFASVGVE